MMKMRFLPDEPIEKQAEDILGFGEFVKLLQTSIYNTQTPFVYGVLGDWGTGKTSILKLLQKQLEDDLENSHQAYIPIWFNAWLYENEADIIYPLLHAVKEDYKKRLGEIDKSGSFWDKFKQVTATSAMVVADVGLRLASKQLTGESLKFDDLAKQRQEIQKRVGSFTDILDGWSNSVEQLHEDFGNLLDQYAEELANSSQYKISQAEKVNFVILIDDLDRCLPETTIAILESIKNYLTVKRGIFVFGLNAKIIYQGIRTKYSGLEIDGREYLEKILNYSFYVPEPEMNKVTQFVTQRFESLVDDASQTKHQERFEEFGQILEACNFNNPRKIKRILNRYLFFISKYESELDSYHHGNIVRFIVMAEYFPTLFQLFLTDERSIRTLKIDHLNKLGTHDFNITEFENKYHVSLPAIYSQLAKMTALFDLNLDTQDDKKYIDKQAYDVFRITRLL